MAASLTAISNRTVVVFLLLTLAPWQSTCRAGWCDGPAWREPPLPAVGTLPANPSTAWIGSSGPAGLADSIERQRGAFAASRDPRLAYELAELLLAQAVGADQAQHLSAPDLYYQAATFAWISLGDQMAAAETWPRAWYVYHGSVARMLATGQRQARVLPGQGFVIQTANGSLCVPFTIRGFVWRPEDFQELHPVGPYRSEVVARAHRRPGWGVPVVVRRARRTWQLPEESFLGEDAPFVATAILQPDVEPLLPDRPAISTAAVLELHNPLAAASVPSSRGPTALAADISALFAFREINQPPSLGPLDMFLQPDSSGGPQGLFFLEPYQPGKIPVVLLHGLLSGPMTWSDMANDLRSVPGFTDQFQIWTFRYATGSPFLESAARMRAATRCALTTVDPAGRDRALQHVVLVGHSMGGLVAKLQVISGGDPLWQAFANRPLDQIVSDEPTRGRLAAYFYFEPQPHVRRVVLIATPHSGSTWATSCLGRLGTSLVRRETAETARFTNLIAANAGVFSYDFQRRIPTSIDMLDPNSKLLQAIRAQPIVPGVHVHTIAGTKPRIPGGDSGDGVVTIDSARHPWTESELFVPTNHTAVHHHSLTTAEVVRILWAELAALRAEE